MIRSIGFRLDILLLLLLFSVLSSNLHFGIMAWNVLRAQRALFATTWIKKNTHKLNWYWTVSACGSSKTIPNSIRTVCVRSWANDENDENDVYNGVIHLYSKHLSRKLKAKLLRLCIHIYLCCIPCGRQSTPSIFHLVLCTLHLAPLYRFNQNYRRMENEKKKRFKSDIHFAFFFYAPIFFSSILFFIGCW